jgi:membrane fusion protein (multidrug efflux system)
LCVWASSDARSKVSTPSSWQIAKGIFMSSEGAAEHDDHARKTQDPRSYDATETASQAQSGSPPDKSSGPEDEGHKGGRPAKPPQKKRSLWSRHPLGVLIAVIVLIALIVLAVLFYLNARHYESTDDAFIDTHLVRIAPRISGRVSKVLVDDNQFVRAGQELVEIDPRDQQAQLNQALAMRAQADAQIAQARAQLLQIAAQIQVGEANVRQAAASARASQAQATYAASDLARYRALKAVNPTAVAEQQLDQSISQTNSTAAQRDAALRQVQSAQAQVRATATQRDAARAQIAAGEAQRQSAQAQIDSATLNLGYTTIRAPEDGNIAQRSVAIGTYLNAGAQVMALVPVRTWVTANFKETQLAHMRAGQPVTMQIDACPAVKINGHVDSIQRGSGQAFGVLPPENATGNFVKVVQRVPVKIILDDVPKDCPVGPGLSVEPRVKVL